MENLQQPNYLFEISWEVCNKIGGIYTVVSTKANTLKTIFGDHYIMIGPETWKKTTQNPYFEEDKTLMANWVKQAKADGLKLRVGRCKAASTNPIVILVDFTDYFEQKNNIFAEFWETYKLDSLQGGWDYIEPAMFGYAAGKIIEHFYEYNLSAKDKIVAHFHEWMTGMGLLYLEKNTPQVATIFTTHATTLGRSIAGNGMKLYGEMANYNPQVMAKNLNVNAKHSMERLAAIQSDIFTTVSDLTAKECNTFIEREIDIVTPNGFDEAFLLDDNTFESAKQSSRTIITQVAEAVTGVKPKDNALLVATSGRYEFINKGIDIFIKALNNLKDKELQKEVWGFVLVPSDSHSPNEKVLKRLHKEIPMDEEAMILSHDIGNYDHDPIIQYCRKVDFKNGKDTQVHLIFVPVYLNGNDGLFNKTYYELLPGFDLTVFPSYYEPWGYTPMESLAFNVPTITTTLTGMGNWMKENVKMALSGLDVVLRNEENREDVVEEITDIIQNYTQKSDKELNEIRENIKTLAKITTWDYFINYYKKAFDMALEKSNDRYDLYQHKYISSEMKALPKKSVQPPKWNKILIEPVIPKELEKLRTLTKNIWWSWNHNAKLLFASIENNLWEQYNHNPIHLLEALTIDQLNNLANDETFMANLNEVYNDFSAYLAEKKNQPKESIAYFSMEYGLHDTIKTYSGGLGMLAGDYLKEASDSNTNMVAVGLLYRYGYFAQHISKNGEQEAIYKPQKFTHLPIVPVRDENDNWLTISLALPGRNLVAKVWRLDVGRIPLYLLDTDIPENQDYSDRFVTHQLYGGDHKNRLKQEILLGIGGIRLLKALNINTDIYHINEGHAALIGIERMKHFINEKHLSFYQAVEVIKGSSLFTTHTPVPAGHDAFDENLMRTYFSHYPDILKISWETLMGLGRSNPENTNEKFSMSVLALNLSQEVNGVSRLHGAVSRDMFQHMYPGYLSNELHIDYVTNGVHYGNWASNSWRQLMKEIAGTDWEKEMLDVAHWRKIYDVEDAKIWDIRNYQRNKLVNYIKKRLSNYMIERQESLKTIRTIDKELSPNKLTFGFARRFATYKRAHLLFTNLDRLSKILNDKDRPAQILFAGKAHPNDKMGQDLLKRIVEISHREEFVGKIIFVEDYDIRLGRKLVQGVDVWLNTPTRPLEASGTSGQKATMNGVLNCSVLDGWWAEGYVEGAGWALKEERTYTNQQMQDELDAETLYDIIETEIVPTFYDRNSDGVPEKWVGMIKKNIAEIAPHYTTRRMLHDYHVKFYNDLFKMSGKLQQDDYKNTRELVKWQQHMWASWDDIKVLSSTLPNELGKPLNQGDTFKAEITLDMPSISPEDVNIEIIFGNKTNDHVSEYDIIKLMELKEVKDKQCTFSCEIVMTKSGVMDYAFRMYPKHKLLKYHQILGLVKWF